MMHLKHAAGIVLVVAASASCGDVVRQGRAPVYLVIDRLEASKGGATGGTPSRFLLSDVLTYITSPAPCSAASPCPTIFNDSGTATLRFSMKEIGTITSPRSEEHTSELQSRRDLV